MRPLCRSHIVPNLVYKPIKNEKRQLLSVGPHDVKKIQTGIWEHLLCEKCEQVLNEHETKFKNIWMDTIPPDFTHLRTKPLEDIIEVSVPDYDSFKLFHLSVFWRAAVSSRHKTGDISLGPHEEAIRQLIYDGNPVEPGVYPFWAVLILDDGGRPVPIVTQLAEAAERWNHHRQYFMSYAFCDWFFVVARQPIRAFAEQEKKNRDRNVFTLLAAHYSQSKSLMLYKAMRGKLKS